MYTCDVCKFVGDEAVLVVSLAETKPFCMRRIAFIFLLFPWAVSAQEDCELFDLQDLAEAYLTTQVDSIVLHLSNGNSQTLDFSNGLNIKFGCTDPAFDEYDPAAIVDDGSCQSLSGCSSNDVASMDGYNYGVVTIGDQCWFAENLRTTVYANGDAIPAGLTESEWTSATVGATAVYGEGSASCVEYSPDMDACDEVQSLAAYGRLYNGYAVDDARGLCPSGWHVPTDGEWTDLEDHIAAQGFFETESTVLKLTTGWYDNGNGTDNFGFSALPGGTRGSINGGFGNAGFFGHWWSSTSNGGNARARSLDFEDPDLSWYDFDPRTGFSVRCLRDAE